MVYWIQALTGIIAVRQMMNVSIGAIMKSIKTTGRGRTMSDAPRIDQLRNVPYKSGSLKVAEIRKVVNAVVKERLAAEAAQHALEAVE